MSVLRKPPALALLAALLAPLPAAAQTTDPNNMVFVPADFELRVSKPDGTGWAFITTDVEKERYFNRARCECKDPIRLRADPTAAGKAKAGAVKGGNVELRVGNADCVTADPTNFRNAKCLTLGKTTMADLFRNGLEVETDVGALFGAPNITDGASCAIQGPQTVWLLVDVNLDTFPDMGFADSSAPKLGLFLDGQAPPPPPNITLTPGNEAINVSWSRDTLIDDQQGYVVFCSRAGLPVFAESYYSGDEFYTKATLCPGKVTQAQRQAQQATPDGGAPTVGIPAPLEMEQLDPRFLCSDLITTSNEWRIRILQNDIKYMVGVASVDIRGNASPIQTVYVQAPVPTRDFYRAYKEAGGQAGGCAYAAGAGPGAALLVLVTGAALLRRRRR
jgi:hypothetical protein